MHVACKLYGVCIARIRSTSFSSVIKLHVSSSVSSFCSVLMPSIVSIPLWLLNQHSIQQHATGDIQRTKRRALAAGDVATGNTQRTSCNIAWCAHQVADPAAVG